MQNADLGKLVLRLTLGILVLLHGINKLVHGIDGIQGMLASHGLPEFIAFGVFLGEVVGPLLVIAGYRVQVGAALIGINMLFAIGLAHANEIFQLNAHGGWQLELQGFYLFAAASVFLLGPGKYAFNKWR